MLDESNELLSLSGDCFSHCVLLQCTIGNGEIVENGMYCFKKKKKKDSWGSAGNESGNKWKICDVGIEEWKPNVICSIIQRTNNERHRSESWELDTGRVYF